MQYAVETWDPVYGTPSEVNELDAAAEQVDLNVEVEAAKWQPVTPDPSLAMPVNGVFIDGVRRFDAHIWMGEEMMGRRGICATVAAGAVICSDKEAEIDLIHIERALHTSADVTQPIVLANIGESYKIKPTKDDSAESLNFSVHNHMARVEDHVSGFYKDADLVVYDGPLNQRDAVNGVGYVKTQHVQYLTDEPLESLAALEVGQRTPVFAIGGRFERWSWFMRLPNPKGPARSGLVRLELPVTVSADVNVVAQRADVVTRYIPRFASETFREARAPQNLYPIAGLERKMRWQLGDRELLERSLRMASAG